MKKFTKIMSLATALTMAAVCFSGCGSKDATTDTASTTTEAVAGAIKIGGIGPITGAAAIYGKAVQNAAKIAVDEINELDGDIKFELKFEDDENDAEKSINAYNNLKDWGMQISMGCVTTTPSIAVSTEADADGYFFLTPSASSTDVLGGQADENGNVSIPRKSHIFQMCFTDPNQGIASADYISAQNLGTKIAVIYNNSDAYSTGIYQKFMTKAKELNLDVVCEKTFTDDSANDFTSQLNDIKAAGADLVYLPIYYTPASLILSQAKGMEYAPKFFGVDGMDGILTLEGFDTSLAEDVMLLTPFTADAEDEKTQNFVKKYKELYGDIPNQFAADAYDVIYSIYEACKKAGVTADMDAETIGTMLTDTFTSGDFTFDGLTGEGMTWSETGEVSKQPKGMIIKDGAYVGM